MVLLVSANANGVQQFHQRRCRDPYRLRLLTETLCLKISRAPTGKQGCVTFRSEGVRVSIESEYVVARDSCLRAKQLNHTLRLSGPLFRRELFCLSGLPQVRTAPEIPQKKLSGHSHPCTLTGFSTILTAHFLNRWTPYVPFVFQILLD